MRYRFTFKAPLEAEVRAIAESEIERCFQAAATVGVDVPHEIRKHCKKLRALFRLVRPAFPAYRAEQCAARDAGRELTMVRDITAHREALQRLRARDPARYGIAQLDAAEAWLAQLQQSTAASRGQVRAVQHALRLLDAQRQRAATWKLDACDFPAVADGFVRAYAAAREALSQARRTPSAAHLHELRKRIKYHRLHLELLRTLWTRPISAAVLEAEDVGELLGQHHDLHMLVPALCDPARGPARLDVHWLERLVHPELRRLERRALRGAQCVLADKPRCLHARYHTFWDARMDAAARRAAAQRMPATAPHHASEH